MPTVGEQLGALGRLAVQRFMVAAEAALQAPQAGDGGAGLVDGWAPPPGLEAYASEALIKAQQMAQARPPIEGPRGPDGMPVGRPQAMVADPWAMVSNLGYKDRAHPITYGTIRAAVERVPPVRVVIQTRLTQVGTFANIQRSRYKVGFKVKKRMAPGQKARSMTRIERKEAERIELALLRGTTADLDDPRVRAHPAYGWMQDRQYRYSFANMLKALVYDSLLYDQMCLEVVRDRFGRPAIWQPVDASTVRLADHGTAFYDGGSKPRTVQVKDSSVIGQWDAASMSFGVRNPSTNVYLHGYGTSETEMVMAAVTALLHAWRYNSNFFTQGTAPKGLLNIKGLVPDKQLFAFRRFWHSMLTGSQNAWKTPITNAEGLEWINLGASNAEMEFSNYFDFLIKIICGVFQMNPAEINFNYGNSGSQRVMFESAPMQKLVDSKDRGLRPLMEFVAHELNTMLVRPMNPDFESEFMGLDALTQDELAELLKKQGETTHTVDELRAIHDMDPMPDGEGKVILNSTWMQWKQAKDAMAAEGGMPGEGEGEAPPGAAGADAVGADAGDAAGADKGGKGEDDDAVLKMLAKLGADAPKKPEKKPEKKPDEVKKALVTAGGQVTHRWEI